MGNYLSITITTLSQSLVKVLQVDEIAGVVYGKWRDGTPVRVDGIDDELPSVGDIIFLTGESWVHSTEDIWLARNSVGIVRKCLSDGRALVDDGLIIRIVANDRQLEVVSGCTVELSEADGIVQLISQEPIASRNPIIDGPDIKSEFLVPKSIDGPTFDDFAGYPEVLQRARDLIETQLNHAELLNEIGVRPVKGILFTGPPGTGKTFLAQIIAQQIEAQFYLVSGPSVVSKWLGDTEGTLRGIFEDAVKSPTGRSIIFFDEIDSIAEHRGSDSHEASKRLVAQLLTLMDGFVKTKSSLIIIAATNRPQVLDPAITRPGRFDWEIEFHLPDFEDRLDILLKSSKKIQCSNNLPFEDVARKATGWSAAELTYLWTEAGLLTAKENRSLITPEDIAIAFESISTRMTLGRGQ